MESLDIDDSCLIVIPYVAQKPLVPLPTEEELWEHNCEMLKLFSNDNDDDNMFKNDPDTHHNQAM